MTRHADQPFPKFERNDRVLASLRAAVAMRHTPPLDKDGPFEGPKEPPVAAEPEADPLSCRSAIIKLWETQTFNTAEIAKILRLRECDVASILHDWRESNRARSVEIVGRG